MEDYYNRGIKRIGSRYTIVPNVVLENALISFRAKGIYAFLRSKPDNERICVSNIVESSKEGRDAVQAAIQELEKAGYIKREAYRDPATQKYVGWVWHIYDSGEL